MADMRRSGKRGGSVNRGSHTPGVSVKAAAKAKRGVEPVEDARGKGGVAGDAAEGLLDDSGSESGRGGTLTVVTPMEEEGGSASEGETRVQYSVERMGTTTENDQRSEDGIGERTASDAAHVAEVVSGGMEAEVNVEVETLGSVNEAPRPYLETAVPMTGSQKAAVAGDVAIAGQKENYGVSGNGQSAGAMQGQGVQPVQAPAGGTAVPAPATFVPVQPLLFEVAWEVCWQLGGIYTVLRSKAPQMTRIWGDRYCLIGPYNADTAAVELEESQPSGPIAVAIERLRAMGIKVHYGHWLITGRPRVILLEFGAAMDRLGEFKYYLWKDHGVSAPDNDGEVNNVLSFGFLVGLFFQELTKVPGVQLPVLAQFHEWMGGFGAMRIKHLGLPVATVFTTHATLLGRYLCTDNPDFYSKLPWINPDHAAGHYNIYARYCIERGATHSADVFTTVSDITGLEAEKLLGRRPDVVTPNGLNIQKFAALHEFQNMHKQYKEVIHQFVAGHFFPSYNFDLDKTIYLVISGRYEYRNKGIDLFIEALARLNHWLRAGGIPITVVAFIITRAPHKNINVDTLRSQMMFDELSKLCESITDEMGRSLLHTVSMGRLPERGELLREEAVVKLKRTMHAWRTWKQPGIVTHDLWDDAKDPVLCQLRSCQLFNGRHDPVKVVFHPDFVSSTSPLIGLDYDQFIRGCHMGVFPSYYEPWGYTPMECIASGVPSITSDLAGFGSYVQQNIQDPNSKGLFIVGRRYASWDQAAHQLTETLFNFCLKDRRSRIELRNRTERLSDFFDWSNLVSHYTDAQRMAMQRKAGVTI